MAEINNLRIERVGATNRYKINRADFYNREGLYLTGSSTDNYYQIVKAVKMKIDKYFAGNYNMKVNKRKMSVKELNRTIGDLDGTKLVFKRKLIY